ncbi:MerR family transcriptional regulator [Microbacterium amylolyticum]|uniref:DNA-binding transcriptional MerR regulator n=1 Tax=Microbacterium amylolyticum TaxID=936337 RepID=A0ABS4ZFF1_9MICO|nr:MerR family transcriptional regulator [Microbacterium amylolyticum]MBP2436016.1 DNA-binding transcriptional MerR regulator [Microbacterium amylolyticum]
MPAAAAESGAAAPLLSIGQVLSKLSGEFPALTSSKLRFLEVQGIVSPQRTSSGYRKFSPGDVERLRLALTLQRDHYLPLSVIREHLDGAPSGDAPRQPDVPESIHPTARTYSRAALLEAAGAPPQLLNDAFSLGLISPAETYDDDTVALMRSLVALDRHGIDPRHVRAMRQSAEREVALIEAALSSLLSRSDTRSRARASELGPQLADRLDEVRSLFVRQALVRVLPE